MFPIPLRASKSERSLRKLKKGDTWSSKFNKPQLAKPDVDFAAFHCGLPREDDLAPLQAPLPSARTRTTSVRVAKRDTLLIDLTNNDLLPALDYAFAILDAEAVPTRSAPPSLPPKTFFSGTSSSSSSIPCTPTSMRSAPPRYVYVSSPLSSSSGHSSLSSTRSSPQKRRAIPPVPHDDPFDPHELSRALSHAQADSSSPESAPLRDLPSAPSVPFPPPATPPAARVPLLQRKPRLHSAESSIDSHESFMSRSYPSSSKVSFARSASSLDHYRDVFGTRGACTSTTSVNNIDPGLAALLPQQPRTPSSLKLFPSSKKSRSNPPRRASTPPPSRGRHGTPSSRPPVPALPDIFLLGPAARREAVSDSNSLLSRSLM